MNCLRCNGKMAFCRKELLQFGKGFHKSSPLDVVILECEVCGKLEFFDSEAKFSEVDVLGKSDYTVLLDETEVTKEE